MSPAVGLIDTQEPINEYPMHSINGWRASNPESPSRFRLGMYKKNMVLEPPRRNTLTLKWDYPRRALSTEKNPKRTINQFITDYANVRPSPTIVPQLRQSKQSAGKSGSGAPQNNTDQMYVGALKDQEDLQSVTASLDKGLVTYNAKA